MAEKIKALETPEKEAAAIAQFEEYFKTKKTGETVNAHEVSKTLGYSVSIIKNLYIDNIDLVNGVKLSTKKNVKTRKANPFLNEKGSIMIGKKFVEELNEKRPEGQKFVEDQQFKVALEGDRIILTKI